MIRITKEKLQELLNKHFPGSGYKDHICDNFSVGKLEEDWLIEHGNEYDAPEYSTERLIAFSKDLGTSKINLSQYSHSGCDTCDYGSDYGLRLYIPVVELDVLGLDNEDNS